MEKDKDHLFDKLILAAALLIILSLVGYLYCATFIKLEASQRDIASMGIGIVGPVIMLLVGFYWGSSRSNKDKDKALQQLADRVPHQTEPAKDQQ